MDGYRRVRIKMTAQVVDLPWPQAEMRVGNGLAEYVDGQKQHGPLRAKPPVKNDPAKTDKVETASVKKTTERAVKEKAAPRAVAS